jgi:transcriptional regulator with XRE-family HTH domain
MPRKKEQTIDAYIGARVRLRRLMLGMSQESLGGQLSLTFQQIQKYEKGVNRISASRLYALARALSVPVNYFFEGLSNPDLPSDYDSLQEANTVSPYLDFVSSGEGVQLNKAFLKIEDDVTRRKILAIVEDIARVAGDTKS